MKDVRLVDAPLLQRLIAGDEFALAELYDRFGSLVYGLARRVTCDETLAEDVTQETFVQLWQAPEAVDLDRGSLRSWLCMVAHRRAVDLVRRSESHRRRVAASVDSLDRESPAADAGLIGDADRKELSNALSTLPRDQRRALELAYYDGMTYRQVANVMGIPEGTAKSRIRLALHRLYDSLHSAGNSLEVRQ